MKTILFGIVLGLAAASAADGVGKSLFENGFENAEVGKLPDGFLVLDGGFLVREDGTNRFLELPGSPLDSFAVQFGPTTGSDVAVQGRIFGTAKGRRYPTFAVGLGGVAGYRLQVSPGKKALEIHKDQELKADVPYEWKPGEWVALRLEIRKVSAAEWKVTGAAQDSSSVTRVEFTAKEEPPTGRASVSGSPFSGTPIRFDDLVVERPGK
jgi:hypothetical protein